MIVNRANGTDRTERLSLRNSHRGILRLFVEPWGEELLMPPNVTYQIVAEGPQGDSLELDIGERSVTVYGWPGAIASVFDGGKLLCECSVPAPLTPPVRRDEV